MQSFDLPEEAAFHAFHHNILAESNRNNVIGGGNVTTGSVDLSVDVEACNLNVNGKHVTTDAGTDITLPAASSEPRKDIIWVSPDGGGPGTIEVTSGDPAPAEAPDGVNPVGEFTTSPEPPAFRSTNGTALAEVWVPANASSNSDLTIYNRRVTARVGAGALNAREMGTDELGGGVTNGQALTNLEGTDLSISNGSLNFTGTTSDGGTGGTSDNAIEVVNAVDDLGADPNGGGDAGAIIQNNQAPGRVIYFPEGRYRVASTPSLRDSNCVEMEGDAVLENRFMVRGPNAEFFPADVSLFSDATGGSGDDSCWIRGNVENEHLRFYLDGITWDLTAEHGGHGLLKTHFGSVVIRDVTIAGQWTREDTQTMLIALNLQDNGATTRIERLRAMDGSIHQPATDGYGPSIGGNEYDAQPGCIYVSQQCDDDTTIRVVDCHIAGWPNNGIYGSAGAAGIRIEGGYWANNGHASIRLGGNRCSVTGARVAITSDVDSTFQSARGIWLREESDSDQTDGGNAPVSEQETTARVENCLITVDDLGGSGPKPHALQVDQTMGAATIEDTVIVSDLARSQEAVYIEQYDTLGGGDQPPEDHLSIAFKNCHIRRNSSGAGSNAIASQRPRVSFENCSFRAGSADTCLDVQAPANRNRAEYCEFDGAGQALKWNGADGVLKYNESEADAPYIGGSAPRLVINGLSNNNGNDPRTGGPWNGNGRTGVMVQWHDSGVGGQVIAMYYNGGWNAWAADA